MCGHLPSTWGTTGITYRRMLYTSETATGPPKEVGIHLCGICVAAIKEIDAQ